MLVWGLGGDHNDFLMVFCIVLGFYLLLLARRRAERPRAWRRVSEPREQQRGQRAGAGRRAVRAGSAARWLLPAGTRRWGRARRS